jgi:hypothetical protein
MLGRALPTLFAVLLGAFAVAGCPSSSGPDQDSGMSDPDGSDPFADTDSDGLCDITEMTRGTDPTLPDTDADGFPDHVEAAYGFDPLLPASPDREIVVVLREDRASTVIVPARFSVRGRGEDFTGAFESLGGTDALGVDATSFWDWSTALFASPPDNVAVIEPEAERFLGVVGMTELFFETSLSFGSNRELFCTRAHSFRYNLKRSDGVFLSGATRHLLVILPPGETVATGVWCPPPAPCH